MNYRARDWLFKNISERADVTLLGGESIGDFEQSLRKGYALAWLARIHGGPTCSGGIYTVRPASLKVPGEG